jgi:hypothetical protein
MRGILHANGREGLEFGSEPGTAGLFERFGDGEEKFLFVGAADELHVDGKALGRASKRKRKAWGAREIQPLAEAHGVSIIVWIAGAVVAGAVRERGSRGDRREKDGNVAELAEKSGAELIAFGAGA